MKKYIYVIIIITVLILSYAGISLYEKSHAQKMIYVVSMTPEEMSASLKDGTIDGFISWEPYPAKAAADGYGRYLVNSKDVWANHPGCVLAISEHFTDENMITALVWAQIKGTRFINDPENREKVARYGSEFVGVDLQVASEAINNTIYIEFPDKNEMKMGFDILDKAGGFKNSPDDVDGFLSRITLDRYYSDIKKHLDADPDWIPPAVNGNLRFGFIDGSIHYLAVYVAQKEGYFDKVGLTPGRNLQFMRFRNGLAITNAFTHREVDVAAFGETPLLRYWINDNGKLYIISGVISGGTALVVRKDSDKHSINDLSGSTIATPGFGSIQDVVMRKMFEGFEIKAV
ncbi:MAG: ABC transporter substrate-binding protein [Candidatus Methanoperedens sp.]|nr:ABC transporter substrate-binding protein [Candidatus Methanoperedens sp.]MCZ7369295.1 ABC transporter substrate-binding protein [Candidatus Methanoperedens sp.]